MALFRLYKYVAVIFVAFSTLSGVAFANDLGYTPCTSSICQKMGEEIINNIDNTVDACDDFYQHACGGFMANHTTTNSEYAPSSVATRVEAARQEIKDILENEDANDAGAIRKAKDLYKTCMIERNRYATRRIRALLNTTGDWPLAVPLSQWNPRNLTWQQIHEHFMNVIVYPGLFDLTVKVERNNSKARVITLIPPEQPAILGNVVYNSALNDARSAVYLSNALQVGKQFMKLTGSNITDVDMAANVTALLEFEAKLIRATKTDIDSGSINRITTIKELQDIWDSAVKNNATYKVDWLETIKRRFKGAGIVVDENEKLALEHGVYFQRLATLLSETPIRTIVNYIHWYALWGLIDDANSWRKFSKIARYFIETNDVSIEDKPMRSLICSLFHRMPHAALFMYVKKHFPERTRVSVSEIIQQLREVSKEMIGNSTWMNEIERKLAKDKIDATVFRIGYPDWYDEPGKLDEYYSELTVGPDYYGNILAANRFDSKKMLMKLRKPVSVVDNDWVTLAVFVGSEYDVSTNSLTLPADMLQMPIFHYEQPLALRFGILGVEIAEEHFHGFDNAGQLTIRDEDGNERQWWSNSTINEYEKKTDCFIKQYNQYEITKDVFTNKSIYVDGALTLNEHLRNNAGCSVGLKALQRYKSLHPNENVKIPALKDYSDEKLYFYGMAMVRCLTLSRENILNRIPEGTNKEILNGAVSNMIEFANAFACPTGSKMNPTNKCVLWD